MSSSARPPRANVIAQRSIDAITGLDYQPAIKWMSLASQFPSFVRGVEIIVSLDEGALRDVTLSLFAQVLDRLFAPYAPANSYVQLIFRSAQRRTELLRRPAQPGIRPVL
ncbi:type VI secretion system baseplate subunit TssF [Burkholderia cepacia]|uniref:type VI secretion system baseplate subunit TssF n=1 Tax=Burkholderia cepacia TaxID=292 RepID=UPI0009BE8F0C|nr:type VI secretion system baseplate subunit TssF [Burkholderia cepacia]